MQVDASDPTPPYEQLRRQLVTLIEVGTLAAGTRLPPVRQLAADLALATGTVARTYRELEKAGLVHSRRGGGTTIAAPHRVLTADDRRERIMLLVREAVLASRLVRATDDDIRHAMEVALRVLGPPSAAV